jgi:hypothetical protein
VVNSRDDGLAIPRLEPGTSVHAIAAGFDYTIAATVGSRSTYVGFAPGCDPSGQPSRLIPSDTPRLGQRFDVRVDRMSQNVGAMVFGASRLPAAIELSSIGMPGCYLHLTADVVVPVVGTAGWGKVEIQVPSHPSFLGATWHNQALLLDPAANVLGVKLSDAAKAEVGG